MGDSALLSHSLAHRDATPKAVGLGDDEADVLIAPGDTYATVTGQRTASSIEFIPRDEDAFVIPYGYLPLLWMKRPATLLVEYPTLFTVRLRAKRVDWLKRLIRDQRLLWIRECSAAEAEALSFAVTAIEILYSYPSRETGIHAARP